MPSMRVNISRSAGFTVIELMVVIPLVVLVVVAMVGSAVILTGDALVAREQTRAIYSAQNALDRMEQDIRISKSILATSGTLPAPQGSNSNFTGTSAFASPANYLVVEQYAMTGGPLDSNRIPVVYANQPNSCASGKEANTILTVKVIYYREGTTLRRRVVVPSYASGAVCDTPWQRNTCKSGHSAGNQCRAADEVIADGVDALTFTYYQNPGDTSAVTSPTSATKTVHAGITIKREIAGREVTATSQLRGSVAGL